ncbi:MAG: VIT1/CCC1 transporter family protein [Desulfurella sp.]|uniref:VIT1/CCC1 transporter family protein n=2 Tax=Desulfurella sp. TaxID=1962857 RepID=UPI003D145418
MENFLNLIEKFYQGEINDYHLYLALSKSQKDEELKNRLSEIAQIEKNHSLFWKKIAKKYNIELKDKINTLKIKIAAFLQKFISAAIIVSLLEAGENSTVKEYYSFLKSNALDEKEKAILKNIILEEIEHESIFNKESKKFGANNVRDFILGMNDGIVEILGTVAGLSAVYFTNPFLVGISGSIVGIAGALSMGIGAFISVRSQRQIAQSKNERNEMLFSVAPKRAIEVLKQDLIDSNIDENIATEITKKLQDSNTDLSKFLTQEVEENELKSGFFTAIAYLIGVLFPVTPFFIFKTSIGALPFSILLAFLALSSVGTVVSIVSGISIRKKIFEMVTSSFFAAAFSFGFGKLMQILFHVSV